MRTQRRIFAFHLLNDRSGSPKVLSQVLRQWVDKEKEVYLCTSLSEKGFLSDIPGVHYIPTWYIFQSNPWLRLIYYTLSQWILFVKMWSKIKKDDIVYVNTVLPFGAALLGKIKGADVIYHIHESTVNPRILKWFLFKVVRITASKIINVSQYVQKSHDMDTIPNLLVYNAIDNAFLENVKHKEASTKPQNVLMVCSLKAYKGVFEYLLLSQDNPKSYVIIIR